MNDTPSPSGDIECPNCGSTNTEPTPTAQLDYQCVDCGLSFDISGRR